MYKYYVGEKVVIAPPNGKHPNEHVTRHWYGSVCRIADVKLGKYKLEWEVPVENEEIELNESLDGFLWDEDELEPYNSVHFEFDEDDIISLLE